MYQLGLFCLEVTENPIPVDLLNNKRKFSNSCNLILGYIFLYWSSIQRFQQYQQDLLVLHFWVLPPIELALFLGLIDVISLLLPQHTSNLQLHILLGSSSMEK